MTPDTLFPVTIFPATLMVTPRSPYGAYAYHSQRVEVAHSWHSLTAWDGAETEDDYVARVAKGKRLDDFREKQRYSRFAMGTPCAWVYDPTDEDREFARDCWVKVLAAAAQGTL